jgi:hypothetical protein
MRIKPRSSRRECDSCCPEEVRAVGAIDGGEERVFAIGGNPAIADEIERKAHGVAGLVTRDTSAAVGADCCEEGVTLRLDFAGLIEEAKLTRGVVVVLRGRKRDSAAGIPPYACVVADFPEAVLVNYTARLLLGAQERR